jgi:hypothetical protein
VACFWEFGLLGVKVRCGAFWCWRPCFFGHGHGSGGVMFLLFIYRIPMVEMFCGLGHLYDYYWLYARSCRITISLLLSDDMTFRRRILGAEVYVPYNIHLPVGCILTRSLLVTHYCPSARTSLVIMIVLRW